MKENKNPYKGENLKIGILGGTFNPVHIGHIHMAYSAMEFLNLDRVVFMLCAIPPHKKLAYNISSDKRLSMLKIALKEHKQFIIDEYEANVKYKTYTYKSLVRINKEKDTNTKIYFIIGADSLMQLDSWKEPEKLMKRTSFALVPREGYTKKSCMKKIEYLKTEYMADIVYIDSDNVNVSSTNIRDMDDITRLKMLDENVYKYIKENRLYDVTAKKIAKRNIDE